MMRPNLAVVGRRISQRDELFDLESALVDPDVRRNPERVRALIHPEFLGLGSSGSVYDRRMIINMISKEESAVVVLRDFETRSISEDTVLVTYRSIGQSGEEARRASLWVKSDNQWRMHFHQGTRIPNRWGRIS